MYDGEDDKAAVLAVLKAETDAWVRRDFEALAQHWVHSAQTRRMVAFGGFGAWVDEGWEVIGARLRETMESFPQMYETADCMTWENVNIVVNGDTAWVTYDLIGRDEACEMAGLAHEMKVFHRDGGAWKIACLTSMHGSVDLKTCPLIQVDADARIIWMNPEAETRIRDHPGLIVAAGRLRARRPDRDAALREALAWAVDALRLHVSPRHTPRQARAVSLGEDAAAVPVYAWVVIEDGRALVSFDDTERLARRIDLAAEVYGLSPAQIRLARLIVGGNDLATAADTLGVSVNTLRTQLQRIFDKTGVRSQAALVRALLSADAPTGQS